MPGNMSRDEYLAAGYRLDPVSGQWISPEQMEAKQQALRAQFGSPEVQALAQSPEYQKPIANPQMEQKLKELMARNPELSDQQRISQEAEIAGTLGKERFSRLKPILK